MSAALPIHSAPSSAPEARFYFKKASLEPSFSATHGITPAHVEKRYRIRSWAIIEHTGSRLGFPRRTMAAAQWLFLRFFVEHAFSEHHFVDVTLACLLAASKIQETVKKFRDILVAAWDTIRPSHTTTDLDPDGPIVQEYRKRIIPIELLLLETIRFEFDHDVPFPYIIKIIKKFNGSKEMAMDAWTTANDLYKTTLPIQFPPHVLACGCIHYAALMNDAFPELKRDGTSEPWYEEFGIAMDVIEGVVVQLLEFYLAEDNVGMRSGVSKLLDLKIALNESIEKREREKERLKQSSRRSSLASKRGHDGSHGDRRNGPGSYHDRGEKKYHGHVHVRDDRRTSNDKRTVYHDKRNRNDRQSYNDHKHRDQYSGYKEDSRPSSTEFGGEPKRPKVLDYRQSSGGGGGKIKQNDYKRRESTHRGPPPGLRGPSGPSMYRPDYHGNSSSRDHYDSRGRSRSRDRYDHSDTKRKRSLSRDRHHGHV